jgi:Ala-tRNA(Pro) deacylase
MQIADIYEHIIVILKQHNAIYRIIDHIPEGRTDIISQIRGNNLAQAAKAIVIMVKIGKKERRYYLAVVPGDCRINLDAMRSLCNGSHAMFATKDQVQELTSCVIGAVPPFSFRHDLSLVVDPLLLENEEIVFNAGRLDRSIFIRRESYTEITHPMLAQITQKS